jgi:hypothetical protein
LTVALGACGDDLGIGQARSAITFGQEDTNGRYPSVGAFMAKYVNIGTFPVCSGTLVHPRVFVTASHCTAAVAARMAAGLISDVYVSFDADPMAAGATLHAVSALKTHPGFGHDMSDLKDVGALVLTQPVSGITPAKLPSTDHLGDLDAAGMLRQGNNVAKFAEVGYGGTLLFPPPQVVYDNKRQYSTSAFRNLHKAWLFLSQNPALGNGGTCYGDSGGPAFWNDGVDDVLVAVTTTGDTACIATGVDYRIDTASSLAFINGVIQSL